MVLRFPCSVVTSVIFVFLASGSLLAGETANSIGKKIPDFKLPDHRGRQVSLSDFQDKKAVVVVFIGTECPINNAYMPTLAGLHKSYTDKAVQFLAINSNLQDNPKRVAEHAKENKVPF